MTYNVLMTKMNSILLIFVINDTVTQTSKYKHIQQIGKPEPFVKNKQSRRTVNIWSTPKIVSLFLVINIRRRNLADV